MELETSERNPTLAEVIRRSIEARLADVRVSIPVVVTKWDATKQMVSVKPLVKEAFLDEDDVRQVESQPVIAGVPVIFPSAGGYRFTFPISDGSTMVDGATAPATTGLAVFSDRSLDRWLSGSGQEVDPEIDHEHAPMDAIFIPGLNPFGASLASCPTDHATIGADGGRQIHMHKDTICIGDEANAQFVALAQKVDQNFQDLKSHFTALEAILGGTGIVEAGNGAPSALQAAIKAALALPLPMGPGAYPTPSAVGSSQAKAAL